MSTVGTYYLPSPMVIGIFEFTMMRTGDGVDHKKCARLFSEYMADPAFWRRELRRGP